MIDAGMNDLVRPALYQARHRIEPLRVDVAAPTAAFRVVGPICESSDDFGAHELPVTPPRSVVIRDAGAYGFTMASEYNGRPVASEVFVAGGRVVSARPRDPVSRWVEARLAT
jgi:diaminopimelate decarboxylase